MIDHQSSSAATPRVPVRGSRTRVGFAALAFAWAIASSVGGPVAAQEASPTPASESPAADDFEALLEGFDFGSGAAVVTIGDERYEFSMAIERSIRRPTSVSVRSCSVSSRPKAIRPMAPS